MPNDSGMKRLVSKTMFYSTRRCDEPYPLDKVLEAGGYLDQGAIKCDICKKIDKESTVINHSAVYILGDEIFLSEDGKYWKFVSTYHSRCREINELGLFI